MRNLTIEFNFTVLNKNKATLKNGRIDIESSQTDNKILENKELADSIKDHMINSIKKDIILLNIVGIKEIAKGDV